MLDKLLGHRHHGELFSLRGRSEVTQLFCEPTILPTSRLALCILFAVKQAKRWLR